jgi:hypothetical protein
VLSGVDLHSADGLLQRRVLASVLFWSGYSYDQLGEALRAAVGMDDDRLEQVVGAYAAAFPGSKRPFAPPPLPSPPPPPPASPSAAAAAAAPRRGLGAGPVVAVRREMVTLDDDDDE